ncbi:MAG: NUDIX hydrolase [Candidatus Hodarchaeales archaeon]
MYEQIDVAERLSFLLNNRKIKKIASNSDKRLKNFELASVLVLIVANQGRGTEKIVFTKRTANLRHHKGQISFPGGKHDPESDTTLLDTAKRETNEEIGIHSDNYEVLGQLDDSPAISGFIITPFVAYSASSKLDYSIREEEVDRLIEVPIVHLLAKKKDYFWTKWHLYKRYLVRLYYYRYDEPASNDPAEMESHIIWGVTGRILTPFLNMIRKNKDLRRYFLESS